MKQPPVHIALLRGINVGGRNKLPMGKLVEIFEELGCVDVRTYIQSGNVLFRVPRPDARSLPGRVTDSIRDALGLEVPVVVRSVPQWRKIVDANPYAEGDFDPKPLAVGFMAKKPTAAAVASLDPDRSPPDSFQVIGSEIYLSLPGGAARSKLTNVYFDKKLGTVTTVRNWNTTLKLLELAEA